MKNQSIPNHLFLDDINKILNRKSNNNIDKVTDNNGDFIFKEQAANYFTNYFVEIAPILTSRLPQNYNVDAAVNIDRYPHSCILWPTNET